MQNMKKEALVEYLLHLADNALVLGQRNAEWCGHGPVLEQDIAITNISLDLVGQARLFYQYAAQLKADGSTEDSLAYLRTERQFMNCLLVEQPNADWAQTILRQYFLSNFQSLLFLELEQHRDEQIAAIAAKSIKEVTYHVRWSSEWVIRLGDGTEESHQRMLKAISELWSYTGEMFMPANYEKESGADVAILENEWIAHVNNIFAEATLPVPAKTFMHSGGKTGNHTEHLGYILTELQYLKRTYPGAEW